MVNWEEKWQKQETGWDVGKPEPALAKLIESGALKANVTETNGGKCLIPGCGTGYSILALSKVCSEVIGLDISETAIAAANKYLQGQGAPEDKARAIKCDFLGPEGLELGPVAMVYDCTFMCIFEPDNRGPWAKRMAEIIEPGGELVMDVFPITSTREGGPPFKVSKEGIMESLIPLGFECILWEDVPESDAARPARLGTEAIARFRRLP
eukprot:m.346071 g.346071  ORF g.346071 m.346071 type:complete len:210 (-) comp28062_c0_seq1:75-704(-)